MCRNETVDVSVFGGRTSISLNVAKRGRKQAVERRNADSLALDNGAGC